MGTVTTPWRVLLVLSLVLYVATTGIVLVERDTSAHIDQFQAAASGRTANAGPSAGLVFASEFDGPAGAGPNAGMEGVIWRTDGCWQAGCMGTLAAFHPENAVQDGHGNLTLTARADPRPGDVCGVAGPCRYTSSRLTMLDWSRGGTASWSHTGGRFEARIKSPVGKGLWPAFWTVGADQARLGAPRAGEIDIFEALGQQPNIVAQFAHGYSPNSTRPNNADLRGQSTVMSAGDIAGWHTYAVDWDPTPATGHIAWSIDGVTQKVVDAADAGPLWNSFTHPHSILLDLAVGGWAGEPDPGVFPATMLVDYVRVYAEPQS